jgi:hypothetical protein
MLRSSIKNILIGSRRPRHQNFLVMDPRAETPVGGFGRRVLAPDRPYHLLCAPGLGGFAATLHERSADFAPAKAVAHKEITDEERGLAIRRFPAQPGPKALESCRAATGKCRIW